MILEAGSLVALLQRPGGEAILEAEATDKSLPDDQRLIREDELRYLRLLSQSLRQQALAPSMASGDDVFIVPGFLGSTLRDDQTHGLIWISPSLVIDDEPMAALKLGGFQEGRPDRDEALDVQIRATGGVPPIYDLLRLDLVAHGFNPEIIPVDWRKDIERSAMLLADKIRNRIGHTTKPLHLVAHSQGNLVARRAIQMLGPQQARSLVRNLVLLGPASFGTFSAAFALAGSPESFDFARKFHVKLPPNFRQVFQSFTGLYQLLPWNAEQFKKGGSPFDPDSLDLASFWKTGVDNDRLKYARKWAKGLDSAFFNERTTILLGDQPTVGAVGFVDGELRRSDAMFQGDGTVPDFLAVLPGVERIFRAEGADHMSLPMSLSVIPAVRAVLEGDLPSIERVASSPALAASAPPSKRTAKQAAKASEKSPEVAVKEYVKAPTLRPARMPGAAPAAVDAKALRALRTASEPLHESVRPTKQDGRRIPSPPGCRRLRVFSYDPILATRLETLQIATITIAVPWEGSGTLTEGPVGEYVEVIDYDPASECFYAPIDLTHEHMTSQDGLAPSESDPQFHQQMAYAVSMATIATFEKALGRTALWASRLVRDDEGEVIREEFVPRLRIYPHALRQANAFYDPNRHALLFGYFPSREQPGGLTLPGGTVFTCQSFDIVAHETTHALLHGLHRYLLESSNPDVHAFHEAFADAVAVFQHFSHVEVVRHQVAKVRGDLSKDNLLGQLAMQFGQAQGEHRAALRQYITQEPDPALYYRSKEAHSRGAVLMAAMFRAFQNIYASRSRDLYRIATGGTGVLQDGDIHPDLVTRLAIEATKSARHILNMCIRALDYVPPVDLTFGEYLRALITADYDLVRDDDRGYRVAVLDAFRSWGIYPNDVNVLDESALLWDPPDYEKQHSLRGIVEAFRDLEWKMRSDRRNIFQRKDKLIPAVRDWLFKIANRNENDGISSFGVKLFGTSYQSIPRSQREKQPPLPKFQIESIRPCLRIGPDGEQRSDIVIEVVQRRAGFSNADIQAKVDLARTPWAFSKKDLERGWTALPTGSTKPDFWFRGGCTLLIDPDHEVVRYCIRKSVLSDERLERQRQHEQARFNGSTAALYSRPDDSSPFGLIHGDFD